MTYPTEIRFGGVKFQIMTSPEPLTHPSLPEGARLHGAADYGRQIIFLWDNKSNPSSAEETFIHEVIEAINGTYDLDMPHQTMKTLSVALHQVLADSQMLFGVASPTVH